MHYLATSRHMIGLHTTPEKRSQIWHIYSQFTPDCLKARDLSSRCYFSDVSDVAEEWNSLNNKGINFNLDGHLLYDFSINVWIGSDVMLKRNFRFWSLSECNGLRPPGSSRRTKYFEKELSFETA